MAIPETRGLRYIDLNKIGIDELGRLQDEYNRIEGKINHHLHTGRRGLIIPRASSGQLRSPWRVAHAGSGKITISVVADLPPYDEPQHPAIDSDVSVAAIDPDGYYFEYEDDHSALATPELLQVPDDNTWYTLVVRRNRTHLEKGYLIVTTGSTTVTGSGTEFSRLLAYTDDALDSPRGARIRVPDDTEYPAGTAPLPLGATGSANGNEGVYEVDRVISDTEIRLRTPILGVNESGLAWMIRGDFQGTAPTAPGGDILRYDRAEFELVARTVVPAAGDIIIADVKYDTGAADPAFQVIDRRMASLYRPWRDRPLGSCRLVPAGLHDPTTGQMDSFFDEVNYRIGKPAGETVENVHVAPRKNGWLAAIQTTARIRIKYFDFVASLAGNAREWDLGVIDADATGNATEGTLLQVPQPDEDAAGAPADPTHFLFYVKSAIAYYRTTADQGATWSAGETAIWDPTTIDPNDEVRDLFPILLQCGRIILAASYWDDSASLWSVRFIFSDDLGVTWDTNTNAGYTWVLDSGASIHYFRPRLFQDDFGRLHSAFISNEHPEEATRVAYYYERSNSAITLSRNGGGTNPLGSAAIGGTPTSFADLLEDADITLWASPDGNATVLTSEPRPWIVGANFLQMDRHVFGTHVDVRGNWSPRILESLPHLASEFYGTANSYAVGLVRRMSQHLVQGGAGVYVCYLEPGEDAGAGYTYFVPVDVDYTPVHLGYCYV